MENQNQFIRTGDAFVDTGNAVLHLLKTEFNFSQNDAILCAIDLYLTTWNKAMYSFFPNSNFTQPGIALESKKENLYDIYINKNYKSAHREKLILTGSGTFVNFYPNLQPPKVPYETVLAHLFVPLGSMYFKKSGLFSIVLNNNPDFMLEMILETLTNNLKTGEEQYPLHLQETTQDYLHRWVSRTKEEVYFEVWNFSNYSQDPKLQIEEYLRRHVESFKLSEKKLSPEEISAAAEAAAEAAETKFQIWKQGLGNPILDEQTLKTNNMRNIFILTIKETNERKCYTSVVSLFTENNGAELGVSRSAIEKYNLSKNDFENDICTIEKKTLKSKIDVLKEQGLL